MNTMIDKLKVLLPGWEVLKDESLLVHSAQLGDLDAFNSIVLKYQDILYNTAFRILEQDDHAGDALQEALISAFQHLHDFHGGSLKAWLMRIVVNKCYDQVRRMRSHIMVSLDEPRKDDSENENENFYGRLQQPPASVEEQVEAIQLKDSLRECLSTLPMDFRTIVTLVDIEEMSYTEASTVLNIPIGTVKSRLARARFDLQQKLKARAACL
jgi:RNA polymerase sigma-70 factor, ECF subfamily